MKIKIFCRSSLFPSRSG